MADVNLTVGADGKQAKAELESVQAAAQKTKRVLASAMPAGSAVTGNAPGGGVRPRQGPATSRPQDASHPWFGKGAPGGGAPGGGPPSEGPEAGGAGDEMKGLAQFARVAGTGAVVGRMVADYIKKVQQAQEEMAKMRFQAELLRDSIGAAMSIGGVQGFTDAISQAASAVKTLDHQIGESMIHNKTYGELLGEQLPGMISQEQREDQLRGERRATAALKGSALIGRAKAGDEELEIKRMRLTGRDREADKLERQIKLRTRLGEINAMFKGADGVGSDTRKKLMDQAYEESAIDAALKNKKDTRHYVASSKAQLGLGGGALMLGSAPTDNSGRIAEDIRAMRAVLERHQPATQTPSFASKPGAGKPAMN